MTQVILLTGPKRFIGQTRRPWVPLSIDLLISALIEQGITIKEMDYTTISRNDPIHNSLIFYSFSQVQNLREYLKDQIHHLHALGNIVMPSYELLLCHENKGYQELYKQRLGIKHPSAYYISKMSDINDLDLRFPLVLKSLDGSNAKGVALVNSKEDIRRVVSSWEGALSLYDRFDLLRRKYLRSSKKFPAYPNYDRITDQEQYKNHIAPQKRFVLQEFVSGLDCDYRVIILWDRFYVSKRRTRKGDWRASGTKLFEYDTKPFVELLEYAQSVYNRVQSPSLAMDVGIKDGVFYLFEFQGSHFGVSPIVMGPGYFSKTGTNWTFHKGTGSYEKELAYAISGYAKHIKP